MVGQVKRTKEDNCERLVKLESRYRVRVGIENGILLVLRSISFSWAFRKSDAKSQYNALTFIGPKINIVSRYR